MYSSLIQWDSLDLFRREVQEAQKILGDKKIDVYSLARVATDVEVDEPYKHAKTLLDEGLFGAVGVSELSAKSLDKVSKVGLSSAERSVARLGTVPLSVCGRGELTGDGQVVDIACIEIEVSLWSYEQDIKDVIAWSTEHKVPILAYSPLGRGFITRTYKSPEDIPEGSYIKYAPRFQGEAFYQNLKLVDELDKVAEKKGVSTSELALAWVIGLSDYVRPHSCAPGAVHPRLSGVADRRQTIPIPGSSKAERVKSNAKAAEIKLGEDDLKEVNRILSTFEPVGGRYPKHAEGVLVSLEPVVRPSSHTDASQMR